MLRLPTQVHYLDNHVAKIVRIRRLTGLLAKGDLKFKSNSRGARLLVEQLREFPLGTHDDGPDALEMAMRLTLQFINTPRYEEPKPFRYPMWIL